MTAPLVLKFCPRCQRHFSTRASLIACARCRADAAGGCDRGEASWWLAGGSALMSFLAGFITGAVFTVFVLVMLVAVLSSDAGEDDIE